MKRRRERGMDRGGGRAGRQRWEGSIGRMDMMGKLQERVGRERRGEMWEGEMRVRGVRAK